MLTAMTTLRLADGWGVPKPNRNMTFGNAGITFHAHDDRQKAVYLNKIATLPWSHLESTLTVP